MGSVKQQHQFVEQLDLTSKTDYKILSLLRRKIQDLMFNAYFLQRITLINLFRYKPIGYMDVYRRDIDKLKLVSFECHSEKIVVQS